MDEHLIERAKQGDTEAVGRLYERHATRVYGVIRRLTGDDVQADDLAQETWIRAIRSLPAFRGEARFATWLHRLAVNTALSALRGSRRSLSLIQDTEALPDPAVPTEQPLLRLSLERALDELPPGMRRVLVLHDVEGYTHEEIGQMLGVTAGTCKSQLFKARAKLREALQPQPAQVEGEEVCST